MSQFAITKHVRGFLALVFIGLSSYSVAQKTANALRKEADQAILDFKLDTAKILAESALVLAWQQQDSVEIGYIFNTQAQRHLKLGNFVEATELYEKSNEMGVLTKNEKLELLSLNILTAMKSYFNEFDAAVKTIKRSITLKLKLQDSLGVVDDYVRLAETLGFQQSKDSIAKYLDKAEHLLQIMDSTEATLSKWCGFYFEKAKYKWRVEGNADKSVALFLKSLSISQSLEDYHQQEVHIYTNLMEIYHELEDYHEALRYYELEMDVRRRTHFMGGVSLSYYNVATSYEELGSLDSATKYYRESFRLLIRENLEEHATIPAGRLALVLLANNSDSASYYYQFASENINRQGNQSAVLSSLAVLGDYNKNIGALQQSAKYYKEAKKIAEKVVDLEMQMQLSGKLAEVYEQLGKYPEALRFSKRFKNLSDSLVNKEQIQALTRVEENYKHQKEITAKENEIQVLEANERTSRLQLFLVLLGLLFVLTVVLLIARYRIRSQKMQAQQLKTIGQFKEAMTGMIAHDLKNPLSVLKAKTAEDAPAQEMTRQMLQLVNNMLDVQKLESAEVNVQRKPVDFRKLIGRSISQVQPLVDEKNLQVVTDMESDSIVSVDEAIMGRVLVNLLTNAIKYAPMNSKVSVTTKHEGDRMKVAVKDQGPGIAMNKQEVIFDPYGQVDPKDSGGISSTGLGLTFCRLALRAHGSEIELISAPGQGAIFQFWLALNAEKSVEEEERPMALIMTDEERAVILSALPLLKSYELHQAVEMEEALESLSNMESEAVRKWVESVLNAAYAGNAEHFDTLVSEVGKA